MNWKILFVLGVVLPSLKAGAHELPIADARDRELSALQSVRLGDSSVASNDQAVKNWRGSLAARQQQAADRLGGPLQEVLAVNPGRAGEARLSGGALFDDLFWTVEGDLIVNLTVVGESAAVRAAVEGLPSATVLAFASTPAYTTVAVRVAPSHLLDVAAIDGVRAVNANNRKIAFEESSTDFPAPSAKADFGVGARAHHQGAAENQAYEGLGIDQVRRLFPGLTGAGVPIGTLSDTVNQFDYVYICQGGLNTDGVAGIAESQLTGDLPANNQLTVLNDNSAQSNDEDEGRAMWELIHDLCPDSPMGFATGHISSATFANSITSLGNNGFIINNDDLISWNEPIYQDNVIATAVNNHIANGGQYFALAHNYGDNSFEDTFNDTNSNNYHNFSGTDELYRLTLPALRGINLGFYWAEPWGNRSASLRLDLYTAIGSPAAVTASTTNSNPYALLTYTNQNNAPQNVWLAVRRVSGSAQGLTFKVISYVNGVGGVTFDEYANLRAGTIPCHAGTPNSIAIGAVPYNNLGTIEGYSGRGPYRQFFDPAGNPFPSGPVTYEKPDFISVTRVDTSFFTNDPTGANGFCSDLEGNGFPNFSGTSAATPNAAAVAVLMHQVAGGAGSITQQECHDILRGTAIDLGVPGWDRVYGYGRINAFGAVLAARGPHNQEYFIYPNQFGQGEVSAQLSPETDIDSVAWSLDRSGAAWIEVLESGAADPMLVLFDHGQSKFLAADYNSGPDADDARIDFTGSQNVVYQAVIASEQGFVGSTAYTFRVSGPTPVIASAVLLNAYGDGSASSTLYDKVDIDYFPLTAPDTATGDLAVTLQPTGFDSLLMAFDSAGNEVGRANGIGSGAKDTLNLSGIQPGDAFVIAVAPRNYVGSGAYTLNVDFSTVPGQPLTLASAPGTAHYIVRPNPVTGRDAVANRTIAVQDVWTAYLHPVGLGGFDFTIESESTNGMLLTAATYDYLLARRSWDGEEGLLGSVSQTVNSPHGEEFYYRVFGLESGLRFGTVNFDTDFMVQPPPGISAVRLAPNTWPSGPGAVEWYGNVSAVGDNDYYRIFVPLNISGSLSVYAYNLSGLDTKLVLYDSTGGLIRVVDNNGSGGFEGTVIQNPTPGDSYYVLVRGSADFNVAMNDPDQVGEYQIRATASGLAWSNVDSDGDGFSDELELALGYSNKNPGEFPPFGDVNGDGMITMSDAIRLARLVGNGTAPYDPLLDINLDGAVDARDALALYGWTISASGHEALPPSPP